MKTVTYPAMTKKEVDFVSCDLCNEKIEEGRFEVDDVKVFHRSGSSYPEGGSGTKVEFDICGNCFNSKLRPWLQGQGAEPTTIEWDF